MDRVLEKGVQPKIYELYGGGGYYIPQQALIGKLQLPTQCSATNFNYLFFCRGALEMVHLEVATSFVQDNLQGTVLSDRA